MISVSSEESIAQNGYRFIPEVFSLDAYKFLGREISMIIDALGVSRNRNSSWYCIRCCSDNFNGIRYFPDVATS